MREREAKVAVEGAGSSTREMTGAADGDDGCRMCMTSAAAAAAAAVVVPLLNVTAAYTSPRLQATDTSRAVAGTSTSALQALATLNTLSVEDGDVDDGAMM
jgi:hypothetical protein